MGKVLDPLDYYLPTSAFSPLEHYYDVQIDPARPSIVDVALSPASAAVKAAGEAVNVGSFSLGDYVDLVLTFSRPVAVVGVPKLLLNARGRAAQGCERLTF